MHVRQRPIVHLERAEPEAGRLAEPLESLPERPQHAEHGDEERGLGRCRADAHGALAGEPVRRYRRSRHGVVLTTRGRPPLDCARAPRSGQNRRRAARAAELTGDENGAQRVAWTDTWRRAQEWLAAKLEGLPLEQSFDAAGNQWWTLRGARSARSLLGGHIDSVPNGGWLDGALNVVAAAEVLRRIAEEGEPPVTVRLVYWADEEGARFGRSLFGSSAAAGLDGRPGRAARAEGRATASRCPTRSARASASTSTRALDARSAARERGRLPRAAHRAGARARVDGPPARRRPRHVRRRAAPDHLARPGRARGLDADGPAPRRARRRRQARARAARDRGSAPAAGRSARPAASSASRGSSRRSSRPPSSCSTSATSTRRSSPRCGRTRRSARERFAAEENIEVDVRADLVDRADPLRRDADRASPTRRSARSRAPRTGSRAARCTTRRRSRAPACRR